MPMRPEDIPRRQERLILADATQRFDGLLINRIFGSNDIAAFAELAHIMRALWVGTLRGRAPTAQEVARTIGMPRTTVLRKLRCLVKQGHIVQDGSTYVISDTALATTTPALDCAIELMLETADALRAVQNEHRNAVVQNGQQNQNH
jgi:DNA-binding IclR family transcriptional regulator